MEGDGGGWALKAAYYPNSPQKCLSMNKQNLKSARYDHKGGRKKKEMSKAQIIFELSATNNSKKR